MENSTNDKKCYNSWSCALSVLIIVFVLGSIVYDYAVSKPQMREDINDIKVEVKQIHEKIDAQAIEQFVENSALDTDTARTYVMK